MRAARPVFGKTDEMSLRPASVCDSINVAARARARGSAEKSAPIRPVCAVSLRKLLFQQLARDDQPLNLAGPLADRAEFHVAIKLLDGIIFDKSVTAMNLQCLVSHLD